MATHSARLRRAADVRLAVQQARPARGLSQNELARDLGLRRSAISEIESGKAMMPESRELATALLVAGRVVVVLAVTEGRRRRSRDAAGPRVCRRKGAVSALTARLSRDLRHVWTQEVA